MGRTYNRAKDHSLQTHSSANSSPIAPIAFCSWPSSFVPYRSISKRLQAPLYQIHNMSCCPPKNRRRSSLSLAFDHFRNKCRRTRIDSLLSPPKPDSGTSNEDLDLSPYDDEGVPSTTGSSDLSLGYAEGKDEEDDDDDDSAGERGGSEEKDTDEHNRRDSKLPNFIFDSDGFDGLDSLEFEAEDSTATSSDEDKRLLSALADFSAEVTEAEDFGRYFSLSHRHRKGKGKEERAVSPIESVSTGVADRSVSASSSTHLLHSDNSGSTLDFEVGVPLQRVVAKGEMQREWATQVQTEPQTQEQSLVQSTYASLDQVVKNTVLMEGEDEEEDRGAGRETAVPVVRTVDGVRLDARPLIRHSGVSAPPHSSLQLHETATSTLHTTTAAGEPSTHRPQLASWFSSSSNSSAGSIHRDLAPSRRRNLLSHQHLPATAISRKRHQTTWDATRPNLPSYPPHRPSYTSAPRDTYPCDPERLSTSPPQTFPAPPGPMARKPYTALCTASAVSSFHSTLNEKLNTAISTGAVKASQIGVKERVRRLSGAKNLQHGWEASARRMSGWGRGIGEAVVASGGVGVGWGDRAAEDSDLGKRSAGVYYGGGFI